MEVWQGLINSYLITIKNKKGFIHFNNFQLASVVITSSTTRNARQCPFLKQLVAAGGQGRREGLGLIPT